MTPLLLLLLVAPSLLLADKTPCKVCRDLTSHFQEHFDKTKGSNFGGGNTAWEEKSLGSYATSETRLVEILEKTAKKCDYKCSSLLEDQEEWLEEWFFKRQDTDLFEEMCVTALKRCCTKNRWGPDCAECPGGVEAPCSGHGKCQDEGERKTNGKLSGTCFCDTGYNGTLCEGCKARFVPVGDNCEACSTLCEEGCTSPGPAGCIACKKGYEKSESDGSCVDINECKLHGCGDLNEECINSPGTFECVCKAGYNRVQGKCQLEELYASEDEPDDEVDQTEETTEETEKKTDEKTEQKTEKIDETAGSEEPFDETKIPAIQEAKRKVGIKPVREGGEKKKKKEKKKKREEDSSDSEEEDEISFDELSKYEEEWVREEL